MDSAGQDGDGDCLDGLQMVGQGVGEEKTDTEKMRDRLKIITRENSPVRTVSDGFVMEECEVANIHQEIMSVREVLEMRTEEVNRLRKELERRRWWREDKGTQPELHNKEQWSPADKTCR